MNSTTLGRASVGTTGVAGRPLHDAPTVTSISGTTAASTAALSTVSWTYAQAQGDAQSWYRVRARNTAGTTTWWDSGWLTGATASVAVDMDTEGVPVDSSTVRWTVDVRSDDWVDAGDARYETQGTGDTTYAWGDPQCTVTTMEGATITGGAVTVTQATDVTAAWTFADGGNTQSAYRVQVREAATDIVITDSGWVASASTSYDLPLVLNHGSRYEVVVQLKNNYGVRST